jgi:hypothetical protein
MDLVPSTRESKSEPRYCWVHIDCFVPAVQVPFETQLYNGAPSPICVDICTYTRYLVIGTTADGVTSSSPSRIG